MGEVLLDCNALSFSNCCFLGGYCWDLLEILLANSKIFFEDLAWNHVCDLG